MKCKALICLNFNGDILRWAISNCAMIVKFQINDGWELIIVSVKAGDPCGLRYWNIALVDTEPRPKK